MLLGYHPTFTKYFFFFSFQLVYPVPLGQVWTHLGPNWFFLPNPIFAMCLNFQQQNPLKNQYLPQPSSENCEINSITFDFPSALQQHHERLQIPIQFSVSTLFNFLWKNGSIINSFHTVVPNSLKPSWCTPTHWELFKDTKTPAWIIVVWEIST